MKYINTYSGRFRSRFTQISTFPQLTLSVFQAKKHLAFFFEALSPVAELQITEPEEQPINGQTWLCHNTGTIAHECWLYMIQSYIATFVKPNTTTCECCILCNNCHSCWVVFTDTEWYIKMLMCGAWMSLIGFVIKHCNKASRPSQQVPFEVDPAMCLAGWY